MMLMTKLGVIASQSGLTFRNITIDSSKIDTDLTDYPVMVKLTPENFDFSKARTDGMDIAFYDTSNNLLDFEMEYFLTNSQGVFHVRIPSVSSTVNTTFRMVYGNGLATDLSNKTGVWDNNFVMVQHMGESLEDSTGNGNDGTAPNGRTIKNSDSIFNGTNQYVEVTDKASLDFGTGTFMLQAIFSLDTFIEDHNPTLISKRQATEIGSPQFKLYIADSGLISFNTYYNDSSRVESVTPITLKTLCSCTVIRNSNGLHSLYKDGELDVSQTLTVRDVTNGQPLWIGDDNRDNYSSPSPYNVSQFDGLIAEVRISNISRSDAWIKADDHNLRLNDLVVIGG